MDWNRIVFAVVAAAHTPTTTNSSHGRRRTRAAATMTAARTSTKNCGLKMRLVSRKHAGASPASATADARVRAIPAATITTATTASWNQIARWFDHSDTSALPKYQYPG